VGERHGWSSMRHMTLEEWSCSLQTQINGHEELQGQRIRYVIPLRYFGTCGGVEWSTEAYEMESNMSWRADGFCLTAPSGRWVSGAGGPMESRDGGTLRQRPAGIWQHCKRMSVHCVVRRTTPAAADAIVRAVSTGATQRVSHTHKVVLSTTTPTVALSSLNLSSLLLPSSNAPVINSAT
jgi:photosystem II stability/assembly factor-like uncharacterized protein